MSDAPSHSAHPADLAHHFEDYEQQTQSNLFGMWAFLVQEVMFFGGLFAAYLYYRTQYPAAWVEGSEFLKVSYGTLNTAVLIGSSLTMALAVREAQLGRRKGTVRFIAATWVLGAAFLAIKWVFEYLPKWDHGIVPGFNWHPHGEYAVEHAQTQIFMGLYFVMTGMHALHMVIGMVIMPIVAKRALDGRYTKKNHIGVEVLGLYWHFVDLVWIFLFPLLYLLGRHVPAA